MLHIIFSELPPASFEALFLEFNLRRLLQWMFLAFIIVLAANFSERMTGYFFFRSMEKKVSLLKDLQALDQSGINQNQELSAIYHQTIVELSDHKVETPRLPNLPQSERLWLFISGSSFFFLLSIIFLLQKEKKFYVYAPLILGLIFGCIGAALPIAFNPWLNYLGFPILQMFLLMLLGFLSRKRKATQAGV